MKGFTLKSYKNTSGAKHATSSSSNTNASILNSGKQYQSTSDFSAPSLGSSDHDFSLATTSKTNLLSNFLTIMSSFDIKKVIVLVLAVLLSLFTFFFIYNSFFYTSKAADYPMDPVEPSTISLTQPNDVSIEVNPTPNGDNIGVSSNQTSVTTNNVTGYNLYLSTESSTDNSLNHASIDGFSISALANPNSNLISSSWGYTTTNPTNPSTSNFNAVPTSLSPTAIKTTTEAVDDESTTVYYGAKVSYNVDVAGMYNNTIVYTAIPRAVNAPTITSVTPSTISISGGDTITIVGTNFNSLIKIIVGGNNCTNISITSATTATCTTPAHSTGTVDVVVTNQGGSATRNNAITYVIPGPTVTSISPNSGHFRGGETFVITGANLTGATAVNFGGSVCRSFSVVSDTEIKCVSSGVSTSLQTNADDGSGSFMTNPTETVSVNVTTPNGSSAANTLFTYRYPNSSFTTGSSYVDIKGTDFGLGGKFQVGGTNCKEQKISSSSTAACVTPALTAGNGKAVTFTAPVTFTTYMQNFSGTCSAPYGTIRVLQDNRDSQNYRVRCMEDGKWWMIDNLKFAPNGTPLNSSNTNLNGTEGDDFISNWSRLDANPVQGGASHGNGICTTDSSVTLVNGAGHLTCNGQTYSDDNDGFIAFTNPAQAYDWSAWVCNNQIMINSESLTNCGYLYNWYTATAGSGNYQNTTYATASICPAGWHLPYNTPINDFGVLNNSMLNGSPSSSSTVDSVATRPNWRYNGKFQGTLSGSYAAGFSSQGTTSYYWSGMAHSTNLYAYTMRFSYASISFGSEVNMKHQGSSIRCVQ